MRVGVYVPETRPESGGALTFVREVIRALDGADTGHEFHILHTGSVAPAPTTNLPVTPLGDVPLNAMANRLGLELVWFLTPETQPVTLPFFVTVWDLEHRNQPYFPEVSVSGWTWTERDLHYRWTLPRAACVIVGTHAGKRQIARFYRVRPDLIAVAPFVAPRFGPQERAEATACDLGALGIRKPFLFYPAQFWPHKNHVTLLHALQRIARLPRDLDLVFTGADKGNLQHVRDVADRLNIADRVHIPGFVQRPTVLALYQQAVALAFPSLFGPDNLPPLEAFALECPVIASQLQGSRQLYGEAALLVDPTDDDAWANAVLSVLDSPHRRAELIAAGRTLAETSTAAAYIEAIAPRLDAFAAIRRCWSVRTPYVHTDGVETPPEPAEGWQGDALTSTILGLVKKLEVYVGDTDAARAQRLTVIEELALRAEQSESDRTARLDLIHDLETTLRDSEADRAARLNLIQELQTTLRDSEADRAARLDLIHGLEATLRDSEADRAARLDLIHVLEAELKRSEAARQVSEEEGELRLRTIESQAQLLEQEKEQRRGVDAQLQATLSRIRDLKQSRSWRWTRAFRKMTDWS